MRILYTSSLLLLLSAFAVSGASAQTEEVTAGPGAQSVTYQINPTHTGAIGVSGVVPPLAVRWSVDFGATVSYPLIAERKVFVLTAINTGGSEYKVQLYALDAATGTTVWGPVSIPVEYYAWAAAAYDNGAVFVVPNSYSDQADEGLMLAFDATNGNQLWSVPLPGQYSFSSPPTALNGIVYTAGAGEGGTVYAVQESDGAVLWTASVENGDNSSPAVTSGSVYVSYACPQTYSFKPKTGALIWHYNGPCEGGGGSTPILYRGSLYVRHSFINSDNGAILNAAKGTITSYFNSAFAPAFYGTNAFYTENGSLTAVDIETGATAWTASPASGDSYSSAPIIVNGIVYVGTAAGNLMGYEAANGANKVSMSMGAPISANDFGSANMQAGLGAGQGILVVPASTKVVALAHEVK